MKAGKHIAVSLALSGAVYCMVHSTSIAAEVFAGGVLMDLDHLYDYWRYPGRTSHRSFDVRHFFEVCENRRFSRVFIFMHSWEIVAAVLIAGWLFPCFGDIPAAIGFGMGAHLLLDAAANRASVRAYSILARAWRRFDGRFFYGE